MGASGLIGAPFLMRCRTLHIGDDAAFRVLEKTLHRIPEHYKKYLTERGFKKEIYAMIREYFDSGDEVEFRRCVCEFAPLTDEHSAELVQKVMILAMEDSGTQCERALKLLVSLCRQEELSEDAIERGFDELYNRMPDLLL